MKFFSEKERSQHPFAKQIPREYWSIYFNYEWLPVHEALLQAPCLEDCTILNLESNFNTKKLQSCLICIFVNDKSIAPRFWQQFLEKFPHTLNDIFIFAAYFSHLDILFYIWNSYPENQKDMIAAGNFYAFQRAAENGDITVLKHLKEWATPEELQNMIGADDFWVFRWAAASGNVEVLEQFKNWAPNELLDMIAANNFAAFRWAAENGHVEVLKQLNNWAPNELQNMMVAYDFRAFWEAASNGRVDVLKQLKEWATLEKLQEMIAVNRFWAFLMAAKNGHVAVLEQFKDWAPDKLKEMIAADNFWAFQRAAENGHVTVLKRLKDWAPHKLKAMITASNPLVFKKAAENGHVAVLKQLKEWSPRNLKKNSKLKKVIAAGILLAFKNATENGNADILEQLKEWVSPARLQEMIAADNFWAFLIAAKNGHVVVLKQLKDWAPDKLKEMIAADNFGAFQRAAENGHVAVLEQLKEWAPDELKEMIVAGNLLAFKKAATNGHIAVLKQLKDWAPDKLKEMILAKNFSFLKIAATQNRALLKELINTQEGIGLLLNVINKSTGQSALMNAIEDVLILKDKGLHLLQMFALTDESLNLLHHYAEQGNLQAQYLLVKWDTIVEKNVQKSALDYRWLAANEHRGACYDIKKYAEAGNPFFQCVYYSLEAEESNLINLLIDNADVRAFFFLMEFDFLHEAVAPQSHDGYICGRLTLLDKMEQQLVKNLNESDKKQHSELWAWVYCLRVLFAIQTQKQIEEKTWAQNPISQVELCIITIQKMIPLLVIHYNQYQNQWSNEQKQDFIRLLVMLWTKTINSQNECILSFPVLRDVNRILVHYLCGNKFGITFNSLTHEQQLKLITLASSGEKTDGDTLNKDLDCILTYCIDQKKWNEFYSKYNLFAKLPDQISNHERKDCQKLYTQMNNVG
jgi:urease accessory protein UreF